LVIEYNKTVQSLCSSFRCYYFAYHIGASIEPWRKTPGWRTSKQM